MTTVLSPIHEHGNFITNIGIQVEPTKEHIISLEPQQKAAISPLFTTERSVTVNNSS